MVITKVLDKHIGGRKVLKDNLRKRREALNLKQENIASACDVDRATVSKWETGEFLPRTEKLLSLSKVLQCPIDDLLKEGE